MVVCLERGADLHMAQLMPLLLTVSCSSKWKCCRGLSLSSAARDMLTTLAIGSSLLWEMMLWLNVSVIKKTKLH